VRLFPAVITTSPQEFQSQKPSRFPDCSAQKYWRRVFPGCCERWQARDPRRPAGASVRCLRDRSARKCAAGLSRVYQSPNHEVQSANRRCARGTSVRSAARWRVLHRVIDQDEQRLIERGGIRVNPNRPFVEFTFKLNRFFLRKNRRPLLSPECFSHPCSSLAGTFGGHSAPGASLCAAGRATNAQDD
jgi:hypothetical protein